MDFKTPFEKMEAELREIGLKLSDPNVISDQNQFRDLARRHSDLESAVALWHDYCQAGSDHADARALLAEADDDEMKEYLQAEAEEAAERLGDLEAKLLRQLVPKDPVDEKNAIVEVRAGTGGEEAAIFAGDLFAMYAGYAERVGWKLEVTDQSESEMGGYKEIAFILEGRNAYGIFKHESGVHRVQRVPKTESQGRIHTSAASVIVLPEAEEVDFDIPAADLKMENFRAGGPGGQHMQKNETAVRVTHVPSGLSVVSSSQRSQHQNREQAVRLLRSRLFEIELERQQAEASAVRREQVKSGDRSEKIRTYNVPQDRMTDHRIGLTLHNLPALMGGELDALFEALAEAEHADRLKELAEG